MSDTRKAGNTSKTRTKKSKKEGAWEKASVYTSKEDVVTDAAGNVLPGLISMPFSMVHNPMILRDLRMAGPPSIFSVHTKRDIARYLSDPARYQRQLRHAIMYVYNASSHFRRLIQYFVGLSDLSYIISPSNRFEIQKSSQRTVRSSYRKTQRAITSMGLDTEIPKILTVCFREDVFYGTFWVTENDIVIIQLPSNHCRISSIEENVFNVEFNFAYFLDREHLLSSYPPEFEAKYKLYKSNQIKYRWIELDSPNSFAVKCNSDITKYALPPFIGVLRDIYELEDLNCYKQNRSVRWKRRTITIPLIAGTPLELYKPQHRFEIKSSATV